MRAAVFEEFRGPIKVANVTPPTTRADSAIIRVEACGICRSDWHGWMGHDGDVQLPHVPGHELAGIVEETGGDVAKWNRGDRITVPFCCGCGSCEQCSHGHEHICDNYTQPGFTQWGAFAEYVEIRYADVNLVRLPDSIDSVTAASLGCRFATSFRGIVAQGRVTESDTVVIHGCGGVGLSAIMIAKALGANVVGVDINERQLTKAVHCGADHVLNAADCKNVPTAIKELTSGGATVSVDALGSKKTCYDAIAGLRKRGRHVQIGLTLGDQTDPPIPMSAVIANELEIVGSHGMQASHYPAMLNMIESGALNPSLLIGETVSLDESCQRLADLNSFSSAGAIVIDHF